MYFLSNVRAFSQNHLQQILCCNFKRKLSPPSQEFTFFLFVPQLFLFNLYPFIQRYLQPHQRGENLCFSYYVLAAHLTDTLVSGKLYLRPPSQNPVFSTPIQTLYFYIPMSGQLQLYPASRGYIFAV